MEILHHSRPVIKEQMRFKELQETIVGISPKVLTNELNQLEQTNY